MNKTTLTLIVYMVFYLIFVMFMKLFFSLCLALPMHYLQSRRCFRSEDRTDTFGLLPIQFAFIFYVIFLLMAVLFGIFFDELSVLMILFAPLGYALLAYILMIPIQYIILYYPRMSIQDQTLYLKGFFTRKAIPFSELQKGYRLMRPFIYNGKVYLKLEQGSIFITPNMYVGGFHFLESLFAELHWEQPQLYKEMHITRKFILQPQKFEYSKEAKALYEMLKKEQEILCEQMETGQQEPERSGGQTGRRKPKPPGVWHNRS